MLPASMTYSTDRSRTSRMAPEAVTAPTWSIDLEARRPPDRRPCLLPAGPAGSFPAPACCSLAGMLDTLPPHWPQRRVPDFVEGVVEQREGRPESADAGPGDHRPQILAGRKGLVVLRPVEHRAPALGVGVAQPDELQARAEQHRDPVGHQPNADRDDQHLPGSPDGLGEDVLAERCRAEQVAR